MQPYKRIFNFEAHFPFQYVYRDIKLAQHELPDHIHDWYELVYVHEGEGTFFIDHTFYEASKGSIFLIPGNTIHRSFPHDINPKLSTAFYFSAAFVDEDSILPSFNYLQAFDTTKLMQQFKIELPADSLSTFESIIEAIHHEYVQKKLGYEQQIKLYIQQLLILLARHAASYSKPNTAGYSSLPSWLKATLSYIDAHLHQELHLSKLAKQAAVSAPHFSRVFKRYTGMNVTSYINAKKMMRAKDLLASNQYTVNEIADQLAFQSMTHFHRTFKLATGLTPNQYKRTLIKG